MQFLNFFLLFVFASFSIVAQNNNEEFNFGILAELTIVNSNQNDIKIEKSKLNTTIYPLSIYFSGRVHITKEFRLELRPGFLFGGEYFTGFEYGFYLRYKFSNSKFYLICGINFHNNFGDAHGVNTVVSVSDDTITQLNISMGYYLKENFGFVISYYQPTSSYKMYSVANSEADYYDVNLRNIIKIGFDYTF
jgi:hypothetical protein